MINKQAMYEAFVKEAATRMGKKFPRVTLQNQTSKSPMNFGETTKISIKDMKKLSPGAFKTLKKTEKKLKRLDRKGDRLRASTSKKLTKYDMKKTRTFDNARGKASGYFQQ